MKNPVRILIVDDNQAIRSFLKSILRKEKYEILEAENGVVGLQMIKKEHPDLVLLDLVMPKLDGIKVCRTVKNDPELCKIPILMTTSRGAKEDVIRGLEAGADDYIVKPYDANELLARVHTFLRAGNLLKQLEREKRDLMAILDISNTITSTLDSREVLYSIVQKVSQIINVSRCSIVRIDADEEKGYVVASNEDPSIYNLAIDLTKYPEIQQVLQTKNAVVIDDVHKDPIVKAVRKTLEEVEIHSLLVLPVIMRRNVIGTVLLRTALRNRSFEEREVQFCQIVANAAANALINASLFESMELANIHLERLATTDGLTGIFNHRYFYKRLEEEFSRTKRYRIPLSLIMMDLDSFKEINDTYGHRTGDQILKEFAAVLKSIIRKSDLVARYGGDEFIILLPHTDRKGAEAEASRVIKAITEHPFEAMNGTHIITSHGISTYPGSRIQKVDDLVRIADQELYKRKAIHRKSLAPMA